MGAGIFFSQLMNLSTVALKIKLAMVVGRESEVWEKVLTRNFVGFLNQICRYWWLLNDGDKESEVKYDWRKKRELMEVERREEEAFDRHVQIPIIEIRIKQSLNFKKDGCVKDEENSDFTSWLVLVRISSDGVLWRYVVVVVDERWMYA